MAILYRPVGLRELALIWDSGLREFPPRLPQEPYFRTVTSYECARQIARDWNTKDEASVFSGFVTRFEVTDSHLARHRVQRVDSSTYSEYRIPANELPQFNRAMQGRIGVEAAFFGSNFEGYVPAKGALKEKTAPEQFVELARIWEFSSVDFTQEVALNRKAIYLNAWFWATNDFSGQKLQSEEKRLMFERLENAWSYLPFEIPWPKDELDRAMALSVSAEAEGAFSGRWRNAMSRAGGRVDNVDSEDRLEIQEDFRHAVQAEKTKRPTGVSVIAIGMFLYAAFYVALVLIAIARPVLLRTGDPEADTDAAFLAAFITPARIGFSIGLGIGLWNLKRWARKSVLFYAVLIVLLNLVSWRGLTVGGAIEIALCISTIGYLTNKRASAAFETSIQARG